MSTSTNFFRCEKALIGMTHVQALPGTPRHTQPLDVIIEQARRDARALVEAGFDGIIVENMHDRPYIAGRVGPEIVASMTRLTQAVIEEAPGLTVGVQILADAGVEALAVAHATGASFIRVENFVFSHVADEGLMPTAAAGPLLRYRRQIGAQRVAIFADIKKKHASHAITADVSLASAAEAAIFFDADGLIVTGESTGRPTSVDDLAEVRRVCSLPLLVGSGATPEQLPALLKHADAVIVGSWIKHDGDWTNPVDPARAAIFVEAARDARRSGSSS